jgi:hypothetical protein
VAGYPVTGLPFTWSALPRFKLPHKNEKPGRSEKEPIGLR